MGLDAVVYCDCFEAGKLNSPPPVPALVFVASDRSLDCKSKNLEELLAFDRWRKGACAHEDGILLHHFIGNVALVGLLHSECFLFYWEAYCTAAPMPETDLP